VSATDRLMAAETFLHALRFVARGDVNAANAQVRYTYFRQKLQEEQKVRDAMNKLFDSIVGAIPSSLNRPAFHN
jgi:hypothetical protein